MMKKIYLLVALLLCLTPRSVQAQVVSGPVYITAQDAGNCATANACVTFDVTRAPAIAIELGGTWTGVARFQCRTFGTFIDVLATQPNSGSAGSTLGGNGTVSFANNGFDRCRVVGSVLSSGAIQVVMRSGYFSAKNGVSSIPLLVPDGTVNLPGFGFVTELSTGMWHQGAGYINFSTSGTQRFRIQGGTGVNIGQADCYTWSDFASTTDLFDCRDAANTQAQKNGTNPQEYRIYGTTTGPKYLQLKHDGTDGIVDTAASSGKVRIGPTNASSIDLGKPLTTVGGVAAVSFGVPVVVAQGRVTAQTAAAASVATYTPTADASFELNANVLITASTTFSFTATCTYTDEGNTGRTQTMTFIIPAGTQTQTIANANGAVPYQGVPTRIRAKASTAITCQTPAGTYTSVTYNVEFAIIRLS